MNLARHLEREVRTLWRYRLPAAAMAIMLALAACAAPAATATPGGGDGESPDAEGPSFDLAGVQITTTSTLFSGLDASLIRTIEIVEEWGAEVDNIVLSQQSGLDAIVAGESNIAGSHDADELIIGSAGGEALLGIGSAKSKMDYVLVAQDEYESVEALEGTTIATSGPAGFNTLLMRFALEDAGLDPDRDVDLAQIGSSGDRASALLAGAASSAALTIDDWFELQTQTENLQILAYFSEVRPEFPNDIYYAYTSYWEDNQEVAQAWACANLEANAWIMADRARYIDWIQEYVEASEEALGETWDFAEQVNMWPTDPDEVIDIEGVQALADILLEIGDIDQAVDAQEIIDLSYIQEAADMGCGQE